MKRRLLSLATCLALCLGLLPVTALAAGSTNTVTGDLTFSADENASGTGYSWTSSTKTLTLDNLSLTGSITVPEDATIIVSGTCSITGGIIGQSSTAGSLLIKGQNDDAKLTLTRCAR